MSDRARLLVIEDDPTTLETCAWVLRLAGYDDVSTTSSGDDGLSLLRNQSRDRPFSLVLLDLRLERGMSGLEVLAAIATDRLGVPAVLMSAWLTDATAQIAKQLGAVDVVDKPFDNERLLRLVETNSSHGTTVDSERAPVETNPTRGNPGYAVQRVADVVVSVTKLERDIPTIRDWGRAAGKSTSTLNGWCTIAKLHAGDALDFARLLRVVVQHSGHLCDWFNVLAVVDGRTLGRLIARGGLHMDKIVPDVRTFLADQQFVTNRALLLAVGQRLLVSKLLQ